MKLFKREKKKLTIDEMVKYELMLDQNHFFKENKLTDANLTNKLQLKVEYTDDMEKGIDACLMPYSSVNDNHNYNGLIKIRINLKDAKFADAHEIIHYVFDVGVGKKVEQVYTKPKRGQTNLEEQCINYLTAAAIMPRNDVWKAIKEYDSNPLYGALQFVKKLQEEYEQSEETIIRRVREVRKLYKKDLADKNITLFVE